MKARHVKKSLETSREIANDKSIKNKAEKDRRVKETTANNTKKFFEERKMASILHAKEREKLSLAHKKQMEEIIQEVRAVRLIFLSFPSLGSA